ncbi:Rqc2 family fibronectin-binding protein [Dethiobacter alkaliphilus]|uniref:Rqc2 family fibronectin-binding protein n=1 Tax=Dethiobacter alkaliphilus TaxID=427926 RepID=UPI0022265129|nr:NFACT family protein [Dethiobacter alkaliphilus]MCW3490910.1 NFACT family protein [Dethiobacter alkaliphilus]
MSYDGITMAAVCSELSKKLDGARIDKISQPQALEITLHLRTRENSYLLTCSADSSFPRIHLATHKPDNPPVAPPFCMLLRKHLSGARLLSVEQVGLERILVLTFRSYDDFGNQAKKSLICEIMGKHSNLILTMPHEGGPQILGAAKIVTEAMSRHRAVMPGEPYIEPPQQDKLDLFSLTEEALAEKLINLDEMPPERAVVSSVMGVGMETAREIAYRAAGGEAAHPVEMARALTVELRNLAQELQNNKTQCCIARPPGKKPFFAPLMLKRVPADYLTCYPSVNEGLDVFFQERRHSRREQVLKSRLLQVAKSAVSRAEKKKRLQEAELIEMAGADRYRIFGELLTASIHLIPSGSKIAEVPNYYAENQEPMSIPLDPALSAQANAQRYFKKYRKLKDGEKILKGRLEETTNELAYLESLLTTIEHADLEALLEIREEMEATGLIQVQQEKKKRADTQASPLHFVSVDGIDIYVGRNNKQNDRLTLKDASGGHIWLHTKDIPGAHVVIKHTNPPETTLVEAARLAARFSRASASANVPVDYTQVKHVRKPKGAKPGMVIYDHHQTLFVTPKT